MTVAEATPVQVKRGGAPDAAPPGREDLRAGAVVGGGFQAK